MASRAFTLTELLVVISIIAIVAAILFPVFARSRNAAKKTSCLANLHQIGLANQLYASDFGDLNVPTQIGETPVVYWLVMLQPYAKSLGPFRCPDEPLDLRMSSPQPGYPGGMPERWSYNYAINDVRDSTGKNAGAASYSNSLFAAPATMIFAVDGWPTASEPPVKPERHEISWQQGSRDAAHTALEDGNPRHNENFGIVFCDGHVVVRRRGLQGGVYVGGTEDWEWLAAGHP
ncbi:MAG: DUF1559 domain-containing protein [Fimbriimonas ginsengisoli]|uniref:DUF1559 domain-containing protein n=1 Tax=Fimbriimonas ginsengisoli TaxID=1005039 RepID=A0A931LR76_FIMGI|nr:DUF1559 domain-containing protein [Fimbriimonas ginsengisoli]